jgi:AAA family ATP:ADP antiporter
MMATKDSQKYGYKRFLPAVAIQFCLAFSFVMLQDLKVSVAVTRHGTELVEIVKMWAGIPMSLILVYLYIEVANKYERHKHLGIFILPMISYFLIYGFYFYSHPDVLHISTERMIELQTTYPGFDKLILMYRHWATCLFYFLADTWAGFIIGVLFWQYLNDTTTVNQAKTVYPALGLFVSFGMVLSKAVSLAVLGAKIHAEYSIQIFVSFVAFMGILAVIIHHLVCKNVVTKTRNPMNVQHVKLNMSTFKTFGHVFTSKYLGLLALAVFCFGAILNLIIILHQSYSYKMVKLGKLAPGTYAELVNKISVISTSFGFLFSVGAMVLSMYLLKKHGWFKAALMTPIMTMITAVVLLFVTYDESLSKEFSPLSYSLVFVLMMMVKQIKHFFFKPIKEMAYIPLKQEMKVKGKAFIDLFVERFAYAFGSIVLSITYVLSPTTYNIESTIYKVALLIMILSLLYLVAIWALAPKFKAAEIQDK